MEHGEVTEEKIKMLEFLQTFEYWIPDSGGIWSIAFFGIGDLVRIQFSRKHFEIVPFDAVMPMVMKLLEEEAIKRDLSIRDLNSLEYTHLHIGEPGHTKHKSFVELSNVIDLTNKRRHELSTLKKNLSSARYTFLKFQQDGVITLQGE